MASQHTAAALVAVRSILDKQIADLRREGLPADVQTTSPIATAKEDDSVGGTVLKIIQVLLVVIDAALKILKILT